MARERTDKNGDPRPRDLEWPLRAGVASDLDPLVAELVDTENLVPAFGGNGAALDTRKGIEYYDELVPSAGTGAVIWLLTPTADNGGAYRDSAHKIIAVQDRLTGNILAANSFLQSDTAGEADNGTVTPAT